MELIEKNDIKFLDIAAIEFNPEKNSFRAFFSYRNSTKPIFAILMNYYKSIKGIWRTVGSLQEPYDFMVTSIVYNELVDKLQRTANGFMEQYNKGAIIDEKVDHVFSSNDALDV